VVREQRTSPPCAGEHLYGPKGKELVLGWVPPMPLRVGAVWQTPEGAWQLWTGEDWLTGPGAAANAWTIQGDVMVDAISDQERWR